MASKQAITAALIVLLLVSGQHGQASREVRAPNLSLVAAGGGSPALKKPSASAAPTPALTVKPPATAAVPAGTGHQEEGIYRGQDEKFLAPFFVPVGRHIVPKPFVRELPKHIARELPKIVVGHCFNVAFEKCVKVSLKCFLDSVFKCS
ncbi:hypothetical protein EJB05_13411 [Eragrostis curvula]|uniref:BURP domain-containing protein n=1 Tax=Eragrostis curvula TaxID=38414 RepID=A0A5J9VWH7_9POAL|nr:hypothetical protein EJB05_13411 [Eragrostis curvula]